MSPLIVSGERYHKVSLKRKGKTKVAFAKPTVCVPAVSEENHKRSLSDILNSENDLARDSKSMRTSTIKVRTAIRTTYSPSGEERKAISQGLQPF